MNSGEKISFRPGQQVFLNLKAIPQIEKDFTLAPVDASSFEVHRITTIANECTCGCDLSEFQAHLPLCNLLRIEELGCNQLLTVITSKGLVRTHPANWFTDQ